MACTLSNRETFVVCNWLESDPARRHRLRERAVQLASRGMEHALPRMGDFLYEQLEAELPTLDGVAAELLRSGLSRVVFYEIALAMLKDVNVPAPAVVSDREPA